MVRLQNQQQTPNAQRPTPNVEISMHHKRLMMSADSFACKNDYLPLKIDGASGALRGGHRFVAESERLLNLINLSHPTERGSPSARHDPW